MLNFLRPIFYNWSNTKIDVGIANNNNANVAISKNFCGSVKLRIKLLNIK